jgi:PAP2 superfamily
MMPTYRLVADAPGRSPVQNARMFALVGMAGDDAYMTTLAAKMYYNFWRPITAIRNAQDDSNAATEVDPAWAPLINTPNHPEYPCGHCTFAGTVASRTLGGVHYRFSNEAGEQVGRSVAKITLAKVMRPLVR